jgi:hypothetical protein
MIQIGYEEGIIEHKGRGRQEDCGRIQKLWFQELKADMMSLGNTM